MHGKYGVKRGVIERDRASDEARAVRRGANLSVLWRRRSRTVERACPSKGHGRRDRPSGGQCPTPGQKGWL